MFRLHLKLFEFWDAEVPQHTDTKLYILVDASSLIVLSLKNRKIRQSLTFPAASVHCCYFKAAASTHLLAAISATGLTD
ncbi:hypothetical protein Plhal304r1_c009g0035161 [Plasmopara halstedii]